MLQWRQHETFEIEHASKILGAEIPGGIFSDFFGNSKHWNFLGREKLGWEKEKMRVMEREGVCCSICFCTLLHVSSGF